MRIAPAARPASAAGAYFVEFRSRHATEPEWSLPGYLEDARRIIDDAVAELATAPALEDPSLTEDFEHLRWFALPAEVQAEMQGRGPARRGHKGLRPGA